MPRLWPSSCANISAAFNSFHCSITPLILLSKTMLNRFPPMCPPSQKASGPLGSHTDPRKAYPTVGVCRDRSVSEKNQISLKSESKLLLGCPTKTEIRLVIFLSMNRFCNWVNPCRLGVNEPLMEIMPVQLRLTFTSRDFSMGWAKLATLSI